MIEHPEIFAIAWALCALSYIAGVLIRTVPMPRARQFGVLLIEDAVLIFAFTVVVFLFKLCVPPLEALLWSSGLWGQEISYPALIAWIDGRIGILVGIVGAAKAILLAGILMLAVGGVLAPFVGFLAGAVLTLFLLRVVAQILEAYWFLLLALGVVFYTIPLRLARHAGAGVIATTLVFYLLLPLMPLFVEFLAPAFQGVEIGLPVVGHIMNLIQEQLFPIFLPVLIYVSILWLIASSVASVLGGSELRLPGL